MDDITVVHHEDDDFAILIRDHLIHVDQPHKVDGLDAGPTPVELFVAALAACAAHYGRRYLARHRLPSQGLEVTAGFTMSGDRPARVTRIRLKVHPPVVLPVQHRRGLLDTVEACTVHNSIRRPPSVDIVVEPYEQVA